MSALAQQRVVLDTNVLVSLYVFADSRFAPLRHEVETGRWLPLSNTVCLDEWRRVLAYPAFALAASARAAALSAYCEHVCMIEPAARERFPLPRCKDRDDQKFLELARDGCAECLITADKALLVLGRRQRMAGRFRILSPDSALAEIQVLPSTDTGCELKVCQ